MGREREKLRLFQVRIRMELPFTDVRKTTNRERIYKKRGNSDLEL